MRKRVQKLKNPPPGPATCGTAKKNVVGQKVEKHWFFPTCQVRLVRFYVSCLLLLVLSSSSFPPPPPPVVSVGPQPRPSMLSVPCRTSTTTIHISVPCRTSTMTIHAHCSLPDLNREYPRPVFPAGPQPRPSPPSVPCRTSTATSRSQWALPDLNGKNVRKDVR